MFILLPKPYHGMVGIADNIAGIVGLNTLGAAQRVSPHPATGSEGATNPLRPPGQP
jgi:hypothetical protein